MAGKVEIRDLIEVDNGIAPKTFEIVALVGDPNDEVTYAVGVNDNEILVTDIFGEPIENEQLAKEIADDFIELCSSAKPA
jgi:hypothetical protein